MHDMERIKMAHDKFKAFLEEKIRENRLLTMEEVAEKTGVSVATISRIRSGKITPSPSTVRQIAVAFGSTFEEAMGIDKEKVCIGAEIIPALLENFNKVTEEQQKSCDALQGKLDVSLQLVEHLTEENRRLVKSYHKARAWAIACAVAFCTLLVVIICILAYDLTHLDRGWFTMFFDKTVNMVAEVLR